MSRGGMVSFRTSFWAGGGTRAKVFRLFRRICRQPCHRPGMAFEPAFVLLAITAELPMTADAPAPLETAEVTPGVMTLEIGADIVLRVPGKTPVERAAAWSVRYEGRRDRRRPAAAGPERWLGEFEQGRCVVEQLESARRLLTNEQRP